MPESPLLNDFEAVLTEALRDLDQRALDLTHHYETRISVKDTEITNLRATITELGAKLESRQTELRSATDQLSALKLETKSLAAEIDSLKREIELLKNPSGPTDPPPPPSPPPPPPPIEVSPAFSIKLGTMTFRPGLNGDRQGNETRYRGQLNNEIDVVVDIKPTDNSLQPQIAVCLERCHADLPVNAPTIDLPFSFRFDNSDGYTQPSLRIHHHTRPRIVFNASKPPKVDLPSLISAGLIPNYDQSTQIHEDDLKRIAAGQHPWPRWKTAFKTSTNSVPYDPISEEYGQIVGPWPPGAGPQLNEPGHLMPVQVIYLLTQDPRAWSEVAQLAGSSGNYAIHYRKRDGSYPRADETGSLPFLQGDGPVTLKSASNVILPIPDVAHQHNLTYVAYLLTGERWYREELEAWPVYNTLTRPHGKDRLSGLLWSGQIRAAVWAVRSLLHAYLATIGGSGSNDNDYYRSVLLTNINWMVNRFANPSSPDHRQTGVCELQPFREAPLLKFVQVLPRPRYFATWHYHILASLMNECVRNGFPEAKAMRDHCTKVVQGQWQHGLSPYHIGWGNHAFIQDNWPSIIRDTFEGRTPTDPPMGQFPPITTPDYVAWARSAVVAAVDTGQSWATPALKWIDTEAPKYKGGVPLVWRINPVKG